MMRTTMLCAALALAIGGCKKDDSSEAPTEPTGSETAETPETKAEPEPAAEPAAEPEPAEIDVPTLASLIEAEKVAVLDANGEQTRKDYGKIPSAKLLSSSGDYELSELPSDKDSKLVFYCSNTKCGAAPKAAKRALLAGYSDVNVLPVGVMGWKEAGQKTETVQ